MAPRLLGSSAPRLLVLAALIAPGKAWAICSWSTGFSLDKKAGKESAVLTGTWSSSPTCGTFTRHHYEVCSLPGATAPTTPTTAGATCTVATGTTADLIVHRSNKQFSARVFACSTSVGCSDYYGLTAGENITGVASPPYDADTATTDLEVWVLEDITSFSGTSTYYTVSNDDANASAALIYPTGFTHAGKLGLWYSVGDPSTQVEKIYYARANATGWQRWNQYFPTNSTSPALVTQDAPGSPSFGTVTHPYVVAAERTNGGGTTRFVRMAMQADDDGDFPFQDWFLNSTDDAGSDFGITCSVSGGCTPASSSVTCAVGGKCDYDGETSGNNYASHYALCWGLDATCNYLSSASHGRFMWGYVMGGAVDFSTDEPSVLFTGNTDEACDPTHEGIDDIYMGAWDPSAERFYVPDDGSGCAEHDAEMDNAHDPGVIPLRAGEFKAYIHDQELDGFKVCYLDAGTGTWGDCQPVTFNWETAVNGTGTGSTQTSGTPIPACIENLDTLVWTNGGATVEGGFARAHATSVSETYRDDSCFSSSSIIYLEHRN